MGGRQTPFFGDVAWPYRRLAMAVTVAATCSGGRGSAPRGRHMRQRPGLAASGQLFPNAMAERLIRVTFPVATPAGDSETAREPPLVPFEEVYRCHAGSVHRFCVSQVCDSAAAEDLTHETFVKAFLVYQRVGPDLTSARAWLLTIARNLCTDHERHRGRWRRLLSRLVERPSATGNVVETVAE